MSTKQVLEAAEADAANPRAADIVTGEEKSRRREEQQRKRAELEEREGKLTKRKERILRHEAERLAMEEEREARRATRRKAKREERRLKRASLEEVEKEDQRTRPKAREKEERQGRAASKEDSKSSSHAETESILSQSSLNRPLKFGVTKLKSQSQFSADSEAELVFPQDLGSRAQFDNGSFREDLTGVSTDGWSTRALETPSVALLECTSPPVKHAQALVSENDNLNALADSISLSRMQRIGDRYEEGEQIVPSSEDLTRPVYGSNNQELPLSDTAAACATDNAQSARPSTLESSNLSFVLNSMLELIPARPDALLRYSYLGVKIGKSLRPAVPKGYTRFEWTCVCGKSLYDDFRCPTPESLHAIQKMIDRTFASSLSSAPGSAREPVSGVSLPPAPVTSSQAQLPGNGPSSTSPSVPDHQSNPPSTASNNTSHQTPSGSSLSHRRLYICAKSGTWTTSVREIDTSVVRDDFVLFAQIRQEYNAISKRTKSITPTAQKSFQRVAAWLRGVPLTRPRTVDFVKFRKVYTDQEMGTTVSVIAKPSIPPNPPVQYGYCYDPAPMDSEPPMAPNEFIHYLLEPRDAHKLDLWGPRFPRHTGSSLLSDATKLPPGWGIEIVEEFNWKLIVIAFSLYTVGVVVAMVVYAVLAEDQASVATYIGNFIGLVATPWGMLLASWKIVKS